MPPKKKTELTSLIGHVTLDKTQELYNHVIKIFGKPGYVEETLAQLGRGEPVKLGGCYDCLHVTIGDAIADMQEVREDPTTKRTADYLSRVDMFVQGLTDAPAGMLSAFKQEAAALQTLDAEELARKRSRNDEMVVSDGEDGTRDQQRARATPSAANQQQAPPSSQAPGGAIETVSPKCPIADVLTNDDLIGQISMFLILRPTSPPEQDNFRRLFCVTQRSPLAQEDYTSGFRHASVPRALLPVSRAFVKCSQLVGAVVAEPDNGLGQRRKYIRSRAFLSPHLLMGLSLKISLSMWQWQRYLSQTIINVIKTIGDEGGGSIKDLYRMPVGASNEWEGVRVFFRGDVLRLLKMYNGAIYTEGAQDPPFFPFMWRLKFKPWIPSHLVFYFELTVIKQNKREYSEVPSIGVGLMIKDGWEDLRDKRCRLGTEHTESLGVEFSYTRVQYGQPIVDEIVARPSGEVVCHGRGIGPGDTVGIGLDCERGLVFWTLNGVYGGVVMGGKSLCDLFEVTYVSEPASKGEAGKKEVGPSRMAQELSTADVAPVVVTKGDGTYRLNVGQFGFHFDTARYILIGPPADPTEHVQAVFNREKEEVRLEQEVAAQAAPQGYGQPVNLPQATYKLEEDENEEKWCRMEDRGRNRDRPADREYVREQVDQARGRGGGHNYGSGYYGCS